ncbi:Flavocytochrome c [Lentinus tigrinus ALCF2SS1-7]|nr:Flavocytochrome c [Lentinus tigrinus ALCF2SS1-7]
MTAPRTIVVGGGLAGLSAAHTALENGAIVVLLDKKPALGGNSVKASSGINGAGTAAQKEQNITDSPEIFYNDTLASARDLARTHLIKALTDHSVPTLEWLTNNFGVDLSLVAQLGGHSVPRTHRGKGGAPGWAMTSALVKKLEAQPERATILKGAKVVKLLREGGRVTGVEYEVGGEKKTEEGSVVIATGGYAADYAEGGYLSQFRPELLAVPTTNGDHATGDGHRLAVSIGGALCDMDQVQVHPTGFVDPKDPSAKTKFLAAEALRGVGGILIDKDGVRFVDELERRDTVTEKMREVAKAGRAPIRLLLNPEAAKTLEAHVGFYKSKGLMREYESAAALAEDAKIPLANLEATFDAQRSYAKGLTQDPFGKTNHTNAVYTLDEPLLVAEMTPVVHYTMGGIVVDEDARVLNTDGTPIPGLFAAGEAIGGVHGRNRLGGSSLLEAVVFGRLAGKSSTAR